MGRDWYHRWGSKSSKKTAGENSADGKPPPPPPPAGCMAAVLHLFHSRGVHLRLQTLNVDFNPSSTRGLQPTISSSVAEEVMVGATASETEPLSDKKSSNNRVGVGTGEFSSGRFITAINIKRRKGEAVKTGRGQSSSDSRTPSLVARLMGLDLFPDGSVSSPRASDPDQPSGRSGSDVHRRVLDRFGERRLSVQVRHGAKEVSVELSRHSCSEIGGERRIVRSPSTREAVKHVKETMSRRQFGTGIMNRVGERRGGSLGPSDPDPPNGRMGSNVSSNHRVLDHLGERRLSVQVRCGEKEASVELSRHSCSEISGERRNVQSPSTREAVEQVKERTVGRHFGTDITNKTEERRRDKFLLSRIGNDTKQGVKSVELGSLIARVLEEPTSDTKHSWSDLYTLSQKQQKAVQERKQKPVTRNYCNPTKENNTSVGSQPRLNKEEEHFFDVVVDHSKTQLTKQFKKQPERTPLKIEVFRGTLAPRLFLSRKLEKEVQDYPCKAVTKRKAHSTKPPITKTLQHSTNARAPPLPPPPPPATPPFVVVADIEKDTRVSTRAIKPTSRAQVLELGFQETRIVWTKMKEFFRINCTDLRDTNVSFRLNHPDLGSCPGSILVDLEREEEEVVKEIEREIVDKLVHDTFVGVFW